MDAEPVALADVPAGNTVVEIACGTGPLLPALLERVGTTGLVVGIEPQLELARVARERMMHISDRCEIRVERGAEAALTGRSADVCIAQTVLCHLPSAEREATLARMLALTRSGGRIVSADQDAETWVVDHPDAALTRRLVAFSPTSASPTAAS